MAWDKKSYDAEYYKKNIFCKRLPFNRSIPEDAELLDFVNRQDNFTAYIKDLIRKDMEHQRIMQIPGPGYRDEDAIKKAEKEGHRILFVNANPYQQVTLAIDDTTGERRILRVENLPTIL